MSATAGSQLLEGRSQWTQASCMHNSASRRHCERREYPTQGKGQDMIFLWNGGQTLTRLSRCGEERREMASGGKKGAKEFRGGVETGVFSQKLV